MVTGKQEREFLPGLRVATVAPSPSTTSVTLPGTTAAFADANIYARATGYIARRNVDIGDRVKEERCWRCRRSTTRFRRTKRRFKLSKPRCSKRRRSRDTRRALREEAFRAWRATTTA